MTRRRARLTLWVVCGAILFDALDLSITQVALPSVQGDLGMPTASLQWVATGYALTYGGLLLLGGRLADLLGRRRVFTAGLVLFAAMSFVSGIAPSAEVLIAARGLQGVGAALTVPASVSIIATTFAEGPERNRALGVFGAAASAGFTVGLVLGGVLTDAFGWRSIFLVKVPFVLAAAAMALIVVAGDRPSGRRRYDATGALTSSAGLVLIVLATTQAAEPTLPAWVIAAGAAAGVAFLAGFVVCERRTGEPLLPLDLFRARTVRIADLASLTVLAAPFGLSFVATIWMQDVLGLSALATGLALLPGAALSMVSSRYLAPAMVQRFGLRASASGAMVVVAAGLLFMLGIGTEPAYATTLLPATVICLGLGMGTAYPIYTIGAVTGVPDERQGLAAGVQSTALQVGGGLGLALVSAAVTLALGDATDPEDLTSALRAGIVVAAGLPLAGAAITLVGLRSEQRRGRIAATAIRGARDA